MRKEDVLKHVYYMLKACMFKNIHTVNLVFSKHGYTCYKLPVIIKSISLWQNEQKYIILTVFMILICYDYKKIHMFFPIATTRVYCIYEIIG
jgi:hypothetical protein